MDRFWHENNHSSEDAFVFKRIILVRKSLDRFPGVLPKWILGQKNKQGRSFFLLCRYFQFTDEVLSEIAACPTEISKRI